MSLPHDNTIITLGEIKMEKKTPMYIVYSLSLTNWLCSHGHKILKVEDSTSNPKLKVFLFEDTKALHSTMSLFTKEG